MTSTFTPTVEKGDVDNRQDLKSGKSAGNCMTQFCSGPGMLLYTIMNDVMRMCNSIQALACKATQTQIALGLKENQAAMDATIASGNAQKNQYNWQAGQAFAGAGVSLCQLGANGALENRSLRAKINQEQGVEIPRLNELSARTPQPGKNMLVGEQMPTTEEAAQLKRMDALTKQEAGQGLSSAETTELGTIRAAQSEKAAKMDAIKERKADLFKNFGAEKSHELDQDAINAMSSEEHNAFQEGIKKEIKLREERVNGYNSQIQNNMSLHKTYGDLLNGATDGVVKLAGLVPATVDKAQQDANATQAQYGTQVAQSNEGVAASQMSEWYKKIEAVVNAMHQGAVAYSQ